MKSLEDCMKRNIKKKGATDNEKDSNLRNPPSCPDPHRVRQRRGGAVAGAVRPRRAVSERG